MSTNNAGHFTSVIHLYSELKELKEKSDFNQVVIIQNLLSISYNSQPFIIGILNYWEALLHIYYEAKNWKEIYLLTMLSHLKETIPLL